MFDLEKQVVFFRESFVPFSEANVSITSSSFLYGLGAFTGIRAYFNDELDQVYLFRLDSHYERFRFVCKLLGYENFLKRYDCDRFCSVLVELARRNQLKQNAYVRVTNFTDESKISPQFVDYNDSFSAFLYPLGAYVPADGMRCCVSSWRRVSDASLPARGKLSGLYLNTAFARTEAIQGGFDEALFLDDRGHVVEGSSENIFIVRKEKLITPPPSDDILEGITRNSVIEIAKSAGMEVEERSIDRTELYLADEVFLTGTAAEVSPVTSIDRKSVADGKIGRISGYLQSRFAEITRGRDDKFRHWLFEVYEK